MCFQYVKINSCITANNEHFDNVQSNVKCTGYSKLRYFNEARKNNYWKMTVVMLLYIYISITWMTPRNLQCVSGLGYNCEAFLLAIMYIWMNRDMFHILNSMKRCALKDVVYFTLLNILTILLWTSTIVNYITITCPWNLLTLIFFSPWKKEAYKAYMVLLNIKPNSKPKNFNIQTFKFFFHLCLQKYK